MILDPSGRGPTARQLTLAGLAVLTTIAVLLYLLALRYTGYFEDKVPVTIVLTSTGDGLPGRADVKFRGMVVGRVAGVDVVARGAEQRAGVDLKPGLASTIPVNVTARVIPNNLFGVTAIELLDNGPETRTLRAGATIPEDTGSETVALQTTLNVLRNVLQNIQPEKLGRVLATLSAALDPAARVPGSTVERLDNWLTEIRATPGIDALLGDLGRASIALSQSAPELVGVLSESVTTARTLAERRTKLIDLLATGNATVDSVNALFARNPDAGKFLVSGLDDLFGGLAKDPEAIPYTAANLNVALQRLATTFHFGPAKQMVWKMDVSFTPFQQYTAQDCPHYGDQYGPRCGGATVPEVAPEQNYPPQLIPKWLDAAGPAPAPVAPLGALGLVLPELPAIPGLPFLPGLPSIPGLSPAPSPVAPVAPDAQSPGAPVQPIALRGSDAVAAIVGTRPTVAQYLLLSPVLAGGSVTVTAADNERASR
ncbi:MlaD family protein [Nocardia gipuzkoensis]|uniref:MlaD family protein n=1 Tax=Nocardia gipuzkoensis TaxID=2749991 RepID=UPI00237E5B8A|nr:MCE family protein [Nocardia gipuzkoensis]MDE1670871.1 MCE family protein [Nocardia gipuzkoensis]